VTSQSQVLANISRNLSLPLIAAPMSGASGPELVIAACLGGIAGSFPTRNCTSSEELDDWLSTIQAARAEAAAADPAKKIGPVSANLIIRGNNRLEADIEAIVRHKVNFVITSVGSPVSIIAPLRAAGIPILADVASMHHAHRALEAGVDGLVLLSAGAGGHTGWANPFAFVRAVRAEYDGPVVLAGGISDGVALFAATVLGCDLAYMGTKFLGTNESRVSSEYKEALLAATMDDIEVGMAPNGVVASMIKGGKGSAGHTVCAVTELLSVGEVIAQTTREWEAARAAR
jgi:nitronate monooxygenase